MPRSSQSETTRCPRVGTSSLWKRGCHDVLYPTPLGGFGPGLPPDVWVVLFGTTVDVFSSPSTDLSPARHRIPSTLNRDKCTDPTPVSCFTYRTF